MAYYFSVPHLGAGSSEVESLGCYFIRLARAHTCTEWQLTSHLTAWWTHAQPDDTKYRFPHATLSSKKSLAVCGYGRDVAKLVDALTLGTGVTTLRAGTLLALQQTASRSSIGTLRPSRAWCPACYEEDLQHEGEVYDRLVWAIAPMQRCAIHKLALMDRCPHCASAQFFTVATRLDHCNTCGNHLLGDVKDRIVAPCPALGEKLIEELVAACAQDPTLTLSRQGMLTFFKQAHCELPKRDPLRNLRSLTSWALPTLTTMLRMATAFNVSLLDFQTAQPPAINRALYVSASPSTSVRRSPRHSPDVRRRVEAALKEVLASPDIPPPYLRFSQKLKVSTGYIAYHFPSLFKAYAQRRCQLKAATQAADLEAAQAVINNGLMDRYAHRQITQKKRLITAAAQASGASIVLARKAVALCEAVLKKE